MKRSTGIWLLFLFLFFLSLSPPSSHGPSVIIQARNETYETTVCHSPFQFASNFHFHSLSPPSYWNNVIVASLAVCISCYYTTIAYYKKPICYWMQQCDFLLLFFLHLHIHRYTRYYFSLCIDICGHFNVFFLSHSLSVLLCVCIECQKLLFKLTGTPIKRMMNFSF